MTKWATTVLEPAQVPRAFQQAFHLMRSGRPGPVLIDLPFDVQMAEIEFDIDTYEPLPVYKPAATRKQIEKALDMLQAAERPLIVAGGGIINADASDLLVEFAELTGVPVIPTLMGWGTIPDDHPLMAGMCGLQTSHRYGNATMLASDFVLGIGNRWANRHTGSPEVYCKGRKFVHVDIEPTQIGRVFTPDFGIVSDAKAALELFVARGPRAEGRGQAEGSQRLGRAMPRAQTHDAAQDQLRSGADEAAARVPVHEQQLPARHDLRHRRSACRRSPARSSCMSSARGSGSTAARPARWAGPFRPRWACAPPTRSAPSSRCRATTTSSS